MDWVGIYLVSEKENSLVKLAYRGAPSRPFFPLTEDFAKNSSNSKVGLTGKLILIENVSEYTDGYYECDSRVQSEVCLPIFQDGKVIGIIDAESHQKNFFSKDKVIELVRICDELGRLIYKNN